MDYLAALQSVVTPGSLFFVLVGVAVGMVVGTLPGLTSVMALSLITPMTFKLDATYGFAMLLGVYNSSIFSGGISAIVINTPGTPASIAQTLDGHKIASSGRAGLALGINVIYSVFGGLFSTLCLMIFCEPLAGLALNFGSAEYFWLSLFGLSMMISISNSALIKGLILGALGFLMSTVGLDPLLGSKRFVGDFTSLLGGISFIPVMIGLFGIGEMFYQISNKHEAGDEGKHALKSSGRMLPNKAEVKQTTVATLIGSVIGVVVGAVPGTGGDISALISWDVSRRVSKHPEEFGKGSLEGLCSTSASNNAAIGGAMTTALALGIPGDSSTAVLLGALTMYGMVPGPTLLSTSGDFVSRLYIIMLVANIFILPVGLITTKACIRLLAVRSECIWMAVLPICCVGSFALNRSFTDVLVMVIAGFFGFMFRKYDWPLGPTILGLLLGEMCETNLRRCLILSGGNFNQLVASPLSIVLIILIAFALLWPTISKRMAMKKAAQ